jgi:hypothetical protein
MQNTAARDASASGGIAESRPHGDSPTFDPRQGLPSSLTPRRGAHPRLLSWGARFILVLAAVKIAGAAVALFALPLSPAAGASIGIAFVLLQLAAFSSAGVVLLIAHSHDMRTASLGAVFLVVASAFATGLYGDLARAVPLLQWLGPLYPDAFLPFFLSTFVAHFPRTRTALHGGRLIQGIRTASLITGGMLFVANALAGWMPRLGDDPAVQILLRRSAAGTLYWTVLFVFVAATLGLMLRGLRTLDAVDRRRIGWFALSFVAGFGPTAGAVVIMARTRWAPLIMETWIRSGLQVLLASVPVTTAYAVLVQRVLPIKVVVRRAIQYALTRSTVIAFIALPTMLLTVSAHRHRHETVETFVTGAGRRILLAIGVSVAVLTARRRILRGIDRMFFRDAYDGQTVLIRLIANCRVASGIYDLSTVVRAALEGTFAPEFADVLIRGADGRTFISISRRLRTLPADAILIESVSNLELPLQVGVGLEGSPLYWLPARERAWLVDSRVGLLMPVRASDGTVTALIVLGDRRSELPYGDAEGRLIAGMAEIAAIAFERQAMRSTIAAGIPSEARLVNGLSADCETAAECPQCGRVEPGTQLFCPACHFALRPAHVPYLLLGKYRFEARLGGGGMALVYRAEDLALQRTVAVKALPGTSPERIQRFRHEARAMAAVSHRHLAAIYTVESWQGRPLLVCEFMPLGTLADRLAGGALPSQQALSLGIALAEALAAIHDAGFLHRDIKPANVGYASPECPKLMDFGIAQAALPAPASAPDSSAARDWMTFETLALTHAIAGTPLYLSPEALAGQTPTSAFDLWSLNVLLLEAITGRHPFHGRTVDDTLKIIRAADLDRVTAALRDVEPRLRTYFEAALSPNPARRPGSARKVARSLRALARLLGGR